jgi:hypothetical protein
MGRARRLAVGIGVQRSSRVSADVAYSAPLVHSFTITDNQARNPSQ